ncbi:MAG: acyl carrier protein [Bradyrhizobium sp.]|uniref:acyl carrier protein n=1 Tax=Bradyrhizobium sp. TaxID=376 RepID=UPI0025BED88E|nr:acyl carrier protein [Bradyrhizobium sp.]MBI5265040.1 acyl carrier protein [Bradyrhizobium sp.]
MDAHQIARQLTTVFHDVMDRDDIVLSDTMSADDLDEWDSLSHIRLMASVERQFGVHFTNAEIGSLKNVGDLIKLISQKTNA